MGGALHSIIWLLVWAALGVFNLWIWQKGKAQSHLLMMIGAFAMAIKGLVGLFNIYSMAQLALWGMTIGCLVFGAGFYLLVKPQVMANIEELKNKAKKVAADVSD